MKKYFTQLLCLGLLQFVVVDGDSLRFGNQEMRLQGIDAPEYHQTCFDKDKKEYSCGQKAREYLESIMSSAIKCEVVTTDKYKRQVVICGDINQKMVASGWAVAYTRYTDAYKKDEVAAKKSKKGLWQGKFMKPELYRALDRANL